MMKTARFATVVEQAGTPAPHVLWVPPDKDPPFQRAVKETRVMTVHQDVRGTRKDYGTVGFAQEPESQYLVFPKSLKRFAGQRIIGINYEAIAAASEVQPSPTRNAKKPKATHLKSTPRSSAARTRAAPAPPPENVVKFAPEPSPAKTSPAPAPRSSKHAPEAHARSQRNGGPSPRDLLPQLRRAARELKSGKAVAAYERIQGLIWALEA